MFRWTTPERRDARAVLERVRDASLTYPEAGATRADELPPGYVHDRHRVELPPGSFSRAADGLRRWQAHLGAGVDVYPGDAPVHPGADVLVVASVGPVHALAPCRIVYVIDEPDAFGFAYGTLPGHPEQGEEAFVIERVAESASFSIVAFSRPAELLARVGRPVARRIQRRVTNAYLDAILRYATPHH